MVGQPSSLPVGGYERRQKCPGPHSLKSGPREQMVRAVETQIPITVRTAVLFSRHLSADEDSEGFFLLITTDCLKPCVSRKVCFISICVYKLELPCQECWDLGRTGNNTGSGGGD